MYIQKEQELQNEGSFWWAKNKQISHGRAQRQRKGS
jgi:hypothetical protein